MLPTVTPTVTMPRAVALSDVVAVTRAVCRGAAPADDQKGVIQEGFGVLDRSGGAVVLSGRHKRHLAAESNDTLKSRSMNFDWKRSGVFRS